MDPKREPNPSDDLDIGSDPIDDEFIVDPEEDERNDEDELLEDLGL